MMKKTILLISLTCLYLTLRSQETRFPVYHKDCSIFEKNAIYKISKIDSIVSINALNYGNTYTGSYFQPVAYNELFKLSNIKSIPRRSTRIFYKLSQDLKTIYIIAIAQNYFIQTPFPSSNIDVSWDMWYFIGENEFFSMPKFVVPLQSCSSFMSKADFDFELTLAETSIKNSITETLITLQHDTIVSVYLDSLEKIASYDDNKIHNMLNEISWYQTPKNNSKILLTQKEIQKNTLCIKSWSDTIITNKGVEISDTVITNSRNIEGAEILFEFNITRDKYVLSADTAVSKLQIRNNFIGIKFKACDKSEVDNTIWMTWTDFFKGYNDPIFEQAITYKINDYLFKKLINN